MENFWQMFGLVSGSMLRSWGRISLGCWASPHRYQTCGPAPVCWAEEDSAISQLAGWLSDIWYLPTWLCSFINSTSFSLQFDISMSGMLPEPAWCLSETSKLILLFPDQRLGFSQSDDLRAWAVWPGFYFIKKSLEEGKICSTSKTSIKSRQWSRSVL